MIGEPVQLVECHGQGDEQYWMLTHQGLILRHFLCIGVTDQIMVMQLCSQAAPWHYDQDQHRLMYLDNDALCATKKADDNLVKLQPCDPESIDQSFRFPRYSAVGLDYPALVEVTRGP